MTLPRIERRNIRDTIQSLENCTERLKFASSPLCPDEAANILVGEATRSTIHALEQVRSIFGFDPLSDLIVPTGLMNPLREFLEAFRRHINSDTDLPDPSELVRAFDRYDTLGV